MYYHAENKSSLVALRRTMTTSPNLVDPHATDGSVWAGQKGTGGVEDRRHMSVAF